MIPYASREYREWIFGGQTQGVVDGSHRKSGEEWFIDWKQGTATILFC